MTLSYCSGIIAGFSNISLAAEVTKIAIEGKDYEYKYLFKNKLNQNGMSTKKAVKKMKEGKF